MSEFKPCPFCGADQDKLIEVWNTRANRWAAFTDEDLLWIHDIFAIANAGTILAREQLDIWDQICAELERRKK